MDRRRREALRDELKQLVGRNSSMTYSNYYDALLKKLLKIACYY